MLAHGCEEKKGDRRPQPCALLIDTGKERHDGTGADCQHRARQRRRGVRDPFRRIAPQEARDRLFGNQGSNYPAMKKAGTKHRRTWAAR